MKKIILILLLLFFIDDTCSNDRLLSKFFQKGYKVKDVRAQVINYDKNYYELLNVKTFKYNRTITAQNITVRFKKDLYDNLEVVVQAYKFLSNEYRHFPIRFQVNLNKAFQANVAGTLKMISCGNITSCYFYKDVTYHVCNFVIDPTYLLPLIPNGQYKVQLEILDVTQPIAEIHGFAEIYTPIVYSKNVKSRISSNSKF